MDLVIARELEIYGSHGMAARDYPAMLAQISGGILSPARLVGTVIGLDQSRSARCSWPRWMVLGAWRRDDRY